MGGEFARKARPHASAESSGHVTPSLSARSSRLVNDVLHSPGQPLDAATRAYMEPRFGHDFSRVRVHAASNASGLAINKPDDVFEQEADRTADTVMRMPAVPVRAGPPQLRSFAPPRVFPMLQRKCVCGGEVGFSGQCAECAKLEGKLQRQSVGRSEPDAVPPIVHDVLRSPGQPLDAGTRAYMEPRFGHDFSKVRVHADAKAAASARAVDALAYTVGRDVVFAEGHHEPNTASGLKLLAHELAHTIQQNGELAGPLPIVEMAGKQTPAEQEADRAVAAIERDAVPPALARELLRLARQPAQSQVAEQKSSASGNCTPAAGYSPDHCSAYLANAWWLPFAYVNNATCACSATPNVPTANCVRKFLQDRMEATPVALKAVASAMKTLEINPATYLEYQTFVQKVLTRRIYQDHVDAYRSCCCPYGPAPYWDWIGVTSVPFQPCSLVGWFIRKYGSCTGAPDSVVIDFGEREKREEAVSRHAKISEALEMLKGAAQDLANGLLRNLEPCRP